MASTQQVAAMPVPDFRPAGPRPAVHGVVRPSLSYWQDAWRRLRRDRRAMASLCVLVALLAFTLCGPLLWPVDPARQDLDQVSSPPGTGARARVVPPWEPMQPVVDEAMAADGATKVAGGAAMAADGAATIDAASGVQPGAATALPAPAGLAPVGEATTQAVRLRFEPVPGAASHRVYRNLFAPRSAYELGLPLAELPRGVASYEDRLDLAPGTWYYSVAASPDGVEESPHAATIAVEIERVISVDEAAARGLDVAAGAVVTLPAHPLGTDYLGRDLLARAMAGARVSLYIGIVAPLVYVLLGVACGAIAGFAGGAVDQLLMRFADFVVALPFLLFMILFRVAFGIGPGESGIVPMLVAMVALGWPSTARLVRGQVLQIREEGYVQAARLMGAPGWYLMLRHMLPNTFGVILVSLTFAVPGAIFTEAFLSFIGMGVAPPVPSWGSMCNEGLKAMLTHPHELVVPALLVSVTVLAFNLLGDGLRDALDARMRSRE
jgi:oligopeptide transport system permease protein